ncbi:uncharacterized protein LOC122257772 [Penaeus japonicus]|uniref:uncharacterized protein LOC122257772 n=1 Tax=Penaeus japonicus TaxID=27405 RepID=UPI001C70F359|nr:uncharacterized protein LOC122257772 [Penaeus japonicus]
MNASVVHPMHGRHSSDMSSQDVLPDSTQDPEDAQLSQNATSPTREDDDPPSPPCAPGSPEQEIVDVESYQPCVVDLTCEDEDEDVVEVVSQEQPVIYLGTEQRRMERRRNMSGNDTPLEVIEDLTTDRQHNAIENNNDEINMNALPFERQQNHWPFESQGVDFHNPDLLFGNLLGDLPVETVEDNPRARPSVLVPRLPREQRHSFRRQRSRSRSPQLFPDAQRDAQRTPEIVQGLDELMAEVEGRMPRVLGQPPSTYNAAMIVAEEHSQRVARITPPEAPPSPPAPEQPTISCLVCFDSIGTIQKSSRTLCSTVCGHVFCSTCIDAVVRQKKQCPVCRKKLTKKQYHPLFI